MYARVTHYQMKPESIEAATALLDELKDQIMALPGMIHFVNMMKPDGTGLVVSLTETQEHIEANTERVKAIWSAFADHLAGPPGAAETMEVIADWTK